MSEVFVSRPYHRSVDSRALRYRIIDTLRTMPDGATCLQIAGLIGDDQTTISSIVSKMFNYGGPIEKIGKKGPAVRWRLKDVARQRVSA